MSGPKIEQWGTLFNIWYNTKAVINFGPLCPVLTAWGDTL